MTVDIDLYSANKQFVLNWFNSRGGKDVMRTISTMGSSTGIPCIVLAYWLGPETNWHPDVLKSIANLKEFYGYTEILSKPQGAPV